MTPFERFAALNQVASDLSRGDNPEIGELHYPLLSLYGPAWWLMSKLLNLSLEAEYPPEPSMLASSTDSPGKLFVVDYHRSHLDIVVMLNVLREVGVNPVVLINGEYWSLRNRPILQKVGVAFMLHLAGTTLPIYVHKPDQQIDRAGVSATRKNVKTLLTSGFDILLFAQGTRTPQAKVQDFQSLLSGMNKVEIVPVSLQLGEVWLKGESLVEVVKRAPYPDPEKVVKVKVHSPVVPEYSGKNVSGSTLAVIAQTWLDFYQERGENVPEHLHQYYQEKS